MNEMRDMAVDVAGVHLELGGRPVLKDVAFQVEPGEYCCIVGPNGAGKSTVLKCLELFYDGWRGDIRIGGRDVRAMSRRDIARMLGYVPQVKGRLPDYEVAEFLRMSRYSASADDGEIVQDALTQVGLDGFSHRLISALSGGECQKVFIAAGLVQATPVLLLDEPATFLDPKYQAETDGLLKRINDRDGKTMICVTHDLNAALRDADKIIAMKHGRVEFVKTPKAVWEEKALDSLFETSFRYFRLDGSGRPMVAFGR